MNRSHRRVRTLITGLAAIVAMIALGAVPAQAVKIENPSPPDFSGELTGGLIQLSGQDEKLLQLPLEFPEDPTTGKPANPTFRGTINAAGSIHIPKAQLVFPALKYEIENSLIDIYLKATADATGFIDPLSGRVDLEIPMQIQAMGNVTVTSPITITVNLGNKCVIGTPEHPIMVRGTTHLGERPSADQVYVANFLPNKSKFPGGLIPAGPYSDEPGLWPAGPQPDGEGYEMVPRAAGSFRLADEALAAPKVGKYDGSDCGSAVNPVLNKELGLPSIEGESTAILDFQFMPTASRPGSAALVQKGVKSNFTIPDFTSENWPSTEIPEIPTHVPFEIRAGQSYFAAGVGPHPGGAFSFDPGDGYEPFTSDPVRELSFETPGLRTISVRARDADGDIDTKRREVRIVPSSDIAVELAAEDDSFRAGSTGRLLVDVTNESESPNTQPISLTAGIPAGTTLDSFDAPDAWSCSNAGETLTCALPAGQLPGGATDRIAIEVIVAAGSPGPLTAAATVEQTGDPVAANNHRAAEIPVRKTDLAIAISRQADPVANGTVPFAVDLSNVGDAETSGDVTVEVELPDGITGLPGLSGGEGWTCDAGPEGGLLCLTGATIDAGTDGAALEVRARIDRTATGERTVRATVATNGDTGAFGGADQAEDSFEISVRPDLALETGMDAELVVGDDGTAWFEVVNESVLPIDGPTRVEADLPDGLKVNQVSGEGWDCEATETGAARIDCSHAGSLEPLEATPRLEASLEVGHGVYPQAEMSATLGNDLDGYARNDVAGATSVVRRLDLNLTKSAVRDFSVGIEGQYRLSVANVGDARTVGPIRVVDELPPELSLAAVSGGGWDCATSEIGRQKVECVTDAVLVAGSAAPVLTVKVDVSNAAADLGEVTNVASVDTERDDRSVELDAPVTANNTGTAVAKAVSVDLSVESRHGADFRVGTERSYSLKVRNVGFFATDPGEPVTVVDQLPVGMVPDVDGIQVDRPGWECSAEAGEEGAGHRVTCVLAAPDESSSAIGRGQTATIDLPVLVTDLAVDPSVNVAEITTRRDDSVERSPNNRSEDPTAVTRIDLGVSAETTVQPRAGGTGAVTVQVANQGNAATTGPTTVDVSLPAGVELRAEGSSANGWRCESDDPGPGVLCEHPSAIAGGSAAAPLEVRMNVSTAAPDEWVTGIAARTEGEIESRLADNDASLSQQLEKIDLALRRSHEPGSIKAGHYGQYALAVENVGNTDSTGVSTVEETLPSDFEEPKASGEGWSCGIDERDLRCTRTHPVPAGEVTPPVTVNFRVPADASGTRELSASLLNQSDPYPANDSAAEEIAIVASADLAISGKPPATMRVGDVTDIAYRIRNVGTEPGGGTGMQMVVFLPENVEPVDTASSDAWACEPSDGDGYRSLGCSLTRELAPGEGSSITVMVRLLSVAGPFSVAASVALEGDPNQANDSVSGESEPLGVDLVTAVDAPNEEMEAGAPNRRLISVSNQGSATTTGTIRVRVPLPDGFAWSDEVLPGTGWRCAQPGGTVVCASDEGLTPGEQHPTLTLDLVPSRSNAPSVEVSYMAETEGESDPADNTVTRRETVLYNPETVIDEAPSGTTTARTARIEFSSDDPAAGFECRIDGEFESCSSPLELSGLEPGAHGVRIRAVNQRGMADPTPAEVSWVVAATEPDGKSGPVKLRLSGGSLDLASLGKVDLEPGQLVLTGSFYENGALELPASGVEFAPVSQKVDASGFGELDVKISIVAIGPGSGALDPDGDASLSLPVEAKLEAALGDVALIGPESDCALRPVQFSLSGSWDASAGTAEVGSTAVALPATSPGCAALGDVVNSLLGLPRDDIAAAFEFDLEIGCGEGEVGQPPRCRAVRPDLVAPKVALGRSKVRSGGRTIVTVKVRNRGDETARNVKVCLITPRKLIRGKGQRCQKLSIAAGRTATRRFSIRAKRVKTRRQATIKVRGPVGSGTGKRTVKRKLIVVPRG